MEPASVSRRLSSRGLLAISDMRDSKPSTWCSADMPPRLGALIHGLQLLGATA